MLPEDPAAARQLLNLALVLRPERTAHRQPLDTDEPDAHPVSIRCVFWVWGGFADKLRRLFWCVCRYWVGGKVGWEWEEAIGMSVLLGTTHAYPLSPPY